MTKHIKFDYCKFCNNQNNKDFCSCCQQGSYFENLENYLKLQTIVHNKYIIDKMLSVNSEGATYLAYDKDSNKKYFLKEYFPENIALRKHNNVIAPQSKQAQYKALLIDFVDLNKALVSFCSSSQSKNIIPIKEIFMANNTAYIAKEYLDLISLEQFLKNTPDNYLSWYKYKSMFFQISNVLSKLYKFGIIHRGISPYNIFLDNSSNIYLDGFSISCVRTADSELKSELYKGFSAPEQYQTNGWQDTSTDVYSLAATLYTMLTGHILSKENNSLKNKLLMPPEVALAIENATQINHKNRTRTVEQFVSELVCENFSTKTAIFNTSDLKTFSNSKKSSDKKNGSKKGVFKNNMKNSNKNSKKHKSSIAVVCLVFLLTAVFFVFAAGLLNTIKKNSKTQKIDEKYIKENSWLFEDTSSSEKSEEESDTKNIQTIGISNTKNFKLTSLPNFVGENIDDIKNNTLYAKKINFTIEKEFSESAINEVIHQEPLPGVSLNNKNSKLDVILKVSQGPEYLEVPHLIGMKIDDAKNLLKSLKIQFEIVEVYDKTYKNDVINAANKQAGEKIIKNKDILILRIKSSQLKNSEPTNAESTNSNFTDSDPNNNLNSENQDPANNSNSPE